MRLFTQDGMICFIDKGIVRIEKQYGSDSYCIKWCEPNVYLGKYESKEEAEEVLRQIYINDFYSMP